MEGQVTLDQVAVDTEETFMSPSEHPVFRVAPVLSFPIPYNRPMEKIRKDRRWTPGITPPDFLVVAGDPVMVALSHAAADSEESEAIGGATIRVPFICDAHHSSPGSRHSDNQPTYEEEFCHRSNLLDTLRTHKPNTRPLYPISDAGGIFSDIVVVYLGPRDKYDKLNPIHTLPVVTVSPVRRPGVKRDGTEYSYEPDHQRMRDKVWAALRICLRHKFDRVVIGDFGLGETYRNPPKGVAELWQCLLLHDPDLRGQFKYVVFAFPDPMQSTTQFLRDERARKLQDTYERRRLSISAENGTSSTLTSTLAGRMVDLPTPPPAPTDMAIFESVFDPDETQRALQDPWGERRHNKWRSEMISGKLRNLSWWEV
ncbi:hypothetical protein E4U17_002912 [Claviceps sp. LM77 group G4]|nr:hypothetical protein E4U17_002912 [Claviceps sp. LM77 group G4]KAG6069727.1 hypothetical protein E4U16_007471 [Claviceps sp. LM84 group G4]KAG6084548.1 hypothetical protein E4U33_003252 [Claviceps sp. LM78 group G4]